MTKRIRSTSRPHGRSKRSKLVEGRLTESRSSGSLTEVLLGDGDYDIREYAEYIVRVTVAMNVGKLVTAILQSEALVCGQMEVFLQTYHDSVKKVAHFTTTINDRVAAKIAHIQQLSALDPTPALDAERIQELGSLYAELNKDCTGPQTKIIDACIRLGASVMEDITKHHAFVTRVFGTAMEAVLKALPPPRSMTAFITGVPIVDANYTAGGREESLASVAPLSLDGSAFLSHQVLVTMHRQLTNAMRIHKRWAGRSFADVLATDYAEFAAAYPADIRAALTIDLKVPTGPGDWLTAFLVAHLPSRGASQGVRDVIAVDPVAFLADLCPGIVHAGGGAFARLSKSPDVGYVTEFIDTRNFQSIDFADERSSNTLYTTTTTTTTEERSTQQQQQPDAAQEDDVVTIYTLVRVYDRGVVARMHRFENAAGGKFLPKTIQCLPLTTELCILATTHARCTPQRPPPTDVLVATRAFHMAREHMYFGFRIVCSVADMCREDSHSPALVMRRILLGDSSRCGICASLDIVGITPQAWFAVPAEDEEEGRYTPPGYGDATRHGLPTYVAEYPVLGLSTVRTSSLYTAHAWAAAIDRENGSTGSGARIDPFSRTNDMSAYESSVVLACNNGVVWTPYTVDRDGGEFPSGSTLWGRRPFAAAVESTLGDGMHALQFATPLLPHAIEWIVALEKQLPAATLFSTVVGVEASNRTTILYRTSSSDHQPCRPRSVQGHCLRAMSLGIVDVLGVVRLLALLSEEDLLSLPGNILSYTVWNEEEEAFRLDTITAACMATESIEDLCRQRACTATQWLLERICQDVATICGVGAFSHHDTCMSLAHMEFYYLFSGGGPADVTFPAILAHEELLLVSEKDVGPSHSMLWSRMVAEFSQTASVVEAGLKRAETHSIGIIDRMAQTTPPEPAAIGKFEAVVDQVIAASSVDIPRLDFVLLVPDKTTDSGFRHSQAYGDGLKRAVFTNYARHIAAGGWGRMYRGFISDVGGSAADLIDTIERQEAGVVPAMAVGRIGFSSLVGHGAAPPPQATKHPRAIQMANFWKLLFAIKLEAIDVMIPIHPAFFYAISGHARKISPKRRKIAAIRIAAKVSKMFPDNLMPHHVPMPCANPAYEWRSEDMRVREEPLAREFVYLSGIEAQKSIYRTLCGSIVPAASSTIPFDLLGRFLCLPHFHITPAVLLSKVTCDGFDKGSQFPAAVAAWIGAMSPADVEAFCTFVRGSADLSNSETCNVHISIKKEKNVFDMRRLPRAETCFNTLNVPDYWAIWRRSGTHGERSVAAVVAHLAERFAFAAANNKSMEKM